ncbi:MAG: hypothetical protein V3W04_01385 [Gammaproteobacteria bacterium]
MLQGLSYSRKNSCVSIYKTRIAVGEAIDNLKLKNFNLQHVSIIDTGFHNAVHSIDFYRTNELICFHGKQNTAFFWVSEFGPLVAAGAIVPILIKGHDTSHASDCFGFDTLAAAFFNIGIPRSSIARYEQALMADQCLLIVHGERNDVEQACYLLHSDTQQVAVHVA